MHTKYDRYRRAPADAGQKEITEIEAMARCGVSEQCMCLIVTLFCSLHSHIPQFVYNSTPNFTHFRPVRRFEKRIF